MIRPSRQDFLHAPDGAVIFFETFGPEESSLPTLVLSDGIGCDGFAWRYLIPQLADRYRILHWHYRGHGRSPVPSDARKIGVDYLCSDLALLLEATQTRSAVLMGHSMGVQVSLEFHRRFPQMVAGLALICGSYGNPLDTFHDSNWLRILFPYAQAVVERYPQISGAVIRQMLRMPFAVDIGMRAEMNTSLIQRKDAAPYFEHLSRMSPLAFVRTLESLSNHSAWDHLPAVKVPTLVVGAEKDSFTPVWLSRRMAQAIPGAEFCFLPAGTHTAPLEQPEILGARVEVFLEKLAAQPARDAVQLARRSPARRSG